MVAGFRKLLKGKQFGCDGPIRTEYTILEHTVSQRTDAFHCVSLRTKAICRRRFRFPGNLETSPQDDYKCVSRYRSARLLRFHHFLRLCTFALVPAGAFLFNLNLI